VIHLIHFSAAPGGIEVLIPNIIKHIPGTDFEVFVIRPAREGLLNVYENEKITVKYGSNFNIGAFLILLKYVCKHHNDTFHLYNTGPYVLLIMKITRVKKVVYSIRGTVYWKKSYQKIIRRISWKLAISPKFSFIANSYYSKACFLRFVGQSCSKIDVIYNPIFSDRLRYKSHKPELSEISLISYVGRLVRGKNLFRWIDISAAIHKNFPSIRFQIYGQGSLKTKLIEYSKKLRIDNIVQFMGFYTDVSVAYHNSDLMLFLSERESFGNVVVESILCGTPVIASDIPSMKEIFENYPDFLIKLDGNPEEDIIHKIQNIAQLRDQMKEAVVEFRDRFSIEKHIEKLNKVYDSFNE
jgi:glycosyltransferase involved in cell wall biosynthesis